MALEGKSLLKGRNAASQPKASTGRGRHGIRANVTTPDTIHNPSTSTSITAPTAQPIPSFTVDQWARLSAVFGSSPSSNKLLGKLEMVDWIIDIGCSHHVTGNESCLLKAKAVFPCPWVSRMVKLWLPLRKRL